MKKRYMDTSMIKADLVKNIQTVEDVVALFPATVAQLDLIIDVYIKNTQNEIQAVIDIPSVQRTFANTALALDRLVSFSDLPITLNAISVLENLSPDKNIRDAAHKAIMRVGNFYVDAISSNKKLFEAFKAYVQGNATTDDLTAEQRYFLKESMDDFIRAGLNLPKETLDQVGLLKKELSELTLTFNKNIAQDNRTIEVDLDGLKGVDSEFIGALKKADKGTYLLGTDYPTRSAIMENCAVEDTRRRYFELFANQGYPENDAILQQVIAKRDQLAHLLGFESFAALDTADQMVHNPARAYHFLHDLIKRAEKKESVEFDLWLADMPASVSLDAQGRIKRWDMNYLQNQYKKKHLSVDEEEIACYFPMEKTVKGLLDIYRQFLSIDFKEIPVTGLWHPEVTLIGVYDSNKKILGYLFMDLYPRDNKYTHAAHATIIPAVMGQDGARVAPAVSVVMANFPKSTASKPALLKRQDVSTFFHEFGHALHALCGATQMASFSGTSVKRDFVEMPSQMLEEWLWDKEILHTIGSHYKTGESMPDALIDSIIALKTFDAGFWVKRQAFFSLIALDYHVAGQHKDPHAVWANLYAQLNPRFAPIATDHGYASFGHLMGYGAKYYGYLWSKVFALDLFDTIKKQGLLNPAMGSKYIQEVIGKGGSQDPNELLATFLGREPHSGAFFKSMDLE